MFTASNQDIKLSLTGRRLKAGIPGPILKKSIKVKLEASGGAIRWSH